MPHDLATSVCEQGDGDTAGGPFRARIHSEACSSDGEVDHDTIACWEDQIVSGIECIQRAMRRKLARLQWQNALLVLEQLPGQGHQSHALQRLQETPARRFTPATCGENAAAAEHAKRSWGKRGRATDSNLSSWHGRLKTSAGGVTPRHLIIKKGFKLSYIFLNRRERKACF